MAGQRSVESLGAGHLGLHLPEIQNDPRALQQAITWLSTRTQSDQTGRTELLRQVARRLLNRAVDRLAAERKAQEQAALAVFEECLQEVLAAAEREEPSRVTA